MFGNVNDINSLKLIDFGLFAQYSETTILTEKCGTALYMAPEVFTNYQYSKVILFISIVCGFVECWHDNVYAAYRCASIV